VSAERDAAAESVVVHELAGLLSGLWSLSEMVASRPDLPDREEFIALMRTEAKKAARTFKDLQNLRALRSGNLAERIEDVQIDDALEAADAIANPDTSGRARQHPSDVTVRADMFALAEFVARLRDLAVELGGEATDGVEVQPDCVDLVYLCGPDDRRSELIEGAERSDGRARLLYVLRRVVERWGGEVRVDTRAGDAAVVVRLRRSVA
jgi:signal transduction histidine kinase